MDRSLGDSDAVTAPIPELDVTTEDRHKDMSPANFTHVIVQVSDNRQKAIMQSVGVEYLSNFPTPFWYYYGKIVAKGIYGNEKQLRLLNCTRVRTREFVSFTNATFADRKAAGKVMPLNVVEVDILKPRPGEPLQLFWKPARGIITQRVKHWVEDLEHLDLSASDHESKETTSANQGRENTDDEMSAPWPETIT